MRKVVVLSWGRDGGEEACSVSGATDEEGGEKDSNARGPARSRRVCSFIGVGFPWPLRFLVDGSSEKGILICSRVSPCCGRYKLWRVSRS